MGSDSKVKIFIMAGILAAAVVGAVLYFMGPGTKTSSSPPMVQQPGGPPAAPGGIPGPVPTTPGAMPAPGMSGTLPGSAGAPPMTGTMLPGVAAPPPVLTPPGAPAILPPPAVNMAGIPDPMAGGKDPVIPKPPIYPRVVMISTQPPVWPARSVRAPDPRTTGSGGAALAPIGRLAGWIFNSNGQLVAIFEDADGIARSVRVGDEVANMTVKSLQPDKMVLVSSSGRETIVKLQGLENYQGKSRSVNVDAISTPTAPTWGGR